MNKLTNFDQYFCYFFGICKREHSGLPQKKNTTAPRRIMKMPTAVSVKEKQGAGLSYSNHNL